MDKLKKVGVTADEVIEVLRRPLFAAYKGEGIDAKFLAKKHKEELEATSHKTYITRQGDVIDGGEAPEWDIRQKARIDAQLVLGQRPQEKADSGTHIGNFNVIIANYEKEVKAIDVGRK